MSLWLNVFGQNEYNCLALTAIVGKYGPWVNDKKLLEGWEKATWVSHEKDLQSEIINLYPSLHAPFDSTTL